MKPDDQNDHPDDHPEEQPRPMHASVAHVLQFFNFEHLPWRLQKVSEPFKLLAERVAKAAPYSQETTVALRKLLEAKDAAIRAVL